MFTLKNLISILTLIVLVSMGLAPLQAQEKYPSRAIDLVIPYPPGGPSDIGGRVFAEGLKKVLKVPITIINKSGGGAIVGAVYVLNAKKDGYTLLSGGGAWLVSSLILKDVPYKDPLIDFIPISLIATAPHGVYVKEDSPIKTLEDLMDKAKKNPKTISLGDAGPTSDSHFNFEIFCSAAGLEFKHVPYSGSAEATAAVLGGHVDLGVATMSAINPFLKAGKVRVLVINVPKRMKDFPDIPTFKEKGFTQTFIPNWQGLIAPAGVPKDVIDILISASDEALKSQDLIGQFAKVDFTVERMGNVEFRTMLENHKKAIKTVAQQLGL